MTCVVQEEIGGVGARYLAQTLFTPAVVVGEPSANTVRRGHRGRTGSFCIWSGAAFTPACPPRASTP